LESAEGSKANTSQYTKLGSTKAQGQSSCTDTSCSTLIISPQEFWKILEPQKLKLKHRVAKGAKFLTGNHIHPLSEHLAPMSHRGFRDALINHIKAPEDNKDGLVIYFNNDWTLIRDLFPKSTVHFLLLPRNPKFYRIHPFQAFKDAEFLESARKEVENAAQIAADELCRKIGSNSKSQRERTEAMLADEPPDPLPPGRDWKKDLKVGVHSLPSMNHLHIHIMSKDNVNDCMTTNHHYNCNNTPFFAHLDEFPLAETDPRWNIEEGRYTKDNVKCWRCGKDFERKFKRLKGHLVDELDEWSKK